jgi:hypothetical protein
MRMGTFLFSQRFRLVGAALVLMLLILSISQPANALPGKETGISISKRKTRRAVRGTKQGRRVPSTVVEGVAHHFEAELIVSHLAEHVARRLRV